MEKQLLYFKEEATEGKTKRFNVYSTHSDDYLGQILLWCINWSFERGCKK